MPLINFFSVLLVNEASSSPEELEDILLDKLVTISQIVNASRCNIPQMPDQQNVDSVFDVSYEDSQPYLHKVSCTKSFSSSLLLIITIPYSSSDNLQNRKWKFFQFDSSRSWRSRF